MHIRQPHVAAGEAEGEASVVDAGTSEPQSCFDVLRAVENPQDEDAVIGDLIDDQIVLETTRFSEAKFDLGECREVERRPAPRIGPDFRNAFASSLFEPFSNLRLALGQIHAMLEQIQFGARPDNEPALMPTACARARP